MNDTIVVIKEAVSLLRKVPQSKSRKYKNTNKLYGRIAIKISEHGIPVDFNRWDMCDSIRE
jgi:hypothetical protein